MIPVLDTEKDLHAFMYSLEQPSHVHYHEGIPVTIHRPKNSCPAKNILGISNCGLKHFKTQQRIHNRHTHGWIHAVHTQREGHKPTNHSLGHFYLPDESESNNGFIIYPIPQLTKDFLTLPNTLLYRQTVACLIIKIQ